MLARQAWLLMFDSVDTVNDCIRIATGVLSTIVINPQRMLAGLSADMLATDLAEYLVRKGARDQAAARVQRGAGRARRQASAGCLCWPSAMCCPLAICLVPGWVPARQVACIGRF